MLMSICAVESGCMTNIPRNFILVALALLPVTAFGTIILLLFSQEQHKSMELLLEQTAASTVSAVQHSITNDIGVLQALANDHALEPARLCGL